MDYDTMGEEVLGDELEGSVLGDGYSTVGAGLRRIVPLRRRTIAVPRKPAWRNQVAPGVAPPGVGLEPLPLVPTLNGGVFTAAFPNITFQARPQAPFRAERLLVSVRRSAGAGAVTILAQNIFVGRQLQLVELGTFDVEFFSPTAFGVRLNLVQADPGMLVRLDCTGSIAVPAGETVSVSMMFLGQTIR